MSTLPVIIEPTSSLRDWLRTQNLVGSRAWAGGLASPDNPTLPAVVVSRIGGQVNAPLDLPAYQFDCWATTASEAASIAGRLATLLIQTGPRTVLATVDGHQVRYGGVIEDTVTIAANPVPDPRFHRYVVTAQIVVIAVPT